MLDCPSPRSSKRREAERSSFMAMDQVKFRKPVVPGDQLILELDALRTGIRVWKMAGKASVRDQLVAEAELMATIG